MSEKLRHEKFEGRSTCIQNVYGVFLVIWIILVIFLGLIRSPMSVLDWLILLIPIAIFIFGMINASSITTEVEDAVFEADFLSLGLVIVLPLLAWISRDYGGDRQFFIRVIVTALILSMLSLLDIWVSAKMLFVAKHSKSALQTMAITLLIYALYTYYVECPKGSPKGVPGGV